MSKPKILTYIDAGASDWTASLMRTIAHQLPSDTYEMQAVLAADILHDNALFDDAVLFVMPGGADLPYCAALNGEPNARIRRFVERGGSYFGICAGAYYACREIAFHAGTSGAITGKRELSFLDAVAVGSLPELTSGMLYDGKPRSASAVEILSRDPGSGIDTPIYVHYHGGCRFDIKAEAQDAVDILGVYSALDGAPPAVVSTRVGLGRAILTGVHVETSEQDYEEVLRGHEDMLDHIHVCHRLAETSGARMRFFRQLLVRAGLNLG